eukprot:GHVN01057100.1.p2 GENE.GHVN01057100.1~~GHVN01057100.1.p2  ORF type:complete len:123 (+),score=60.41 GHVN01057100.1:304-672(+)
MPLLTPLNRRTGVTCFTLPTSPTQLTLTTSLPPVTSLNSLTPLTSLTLLTPLTSHTRLALLILPHPQWRRQSKERPLGCLWLCALSRYSPNQQQRFQVESEVCEVSEVSELSMLSEVREVWD